MSAKELAEELGTAWERVGKDAQDAAERRRKQFRDGVIGIDEFLYFAKRGHREGGYTGGTSFKATNHRSIILESLRNNPDVTVSTLHDGNGKVVRVSVRWNPRVRLYLSP